jgi:hypothetical protein
LTAVAVFPLTAGEKKSEDKVTVESVKGPAQYCDTSGGKTKWVALKKGDKLGELTVVRTGFGSNVVLHFKDDTRVTIHGAAKMGIREFKKSEKVTTTKIGLKYGVIKARVDSTRNPNDFKVKVQNTTLAITGSGGVAGGFADAGAFFANLFGEMGVSNAAGFLQLLEGHFTNGTLDDFFQLLADWLSTNQGGFDSNPNDYEFWNQFGFSGRPPDWFDLWRGFIHKKMRRQKIIFGELIGPRKTRR